MSIAPLSSMSGPNIESNFGYPGESQALDMEMVSTLGSANTANSGTGASSSSSSQSSSDSGSAGTGFAGVGGMVDTTA